MHLPVLATASVDMASCTPDGIGFCYATLPSPVTLQAGGTYFILAAEKTDGDPIFWGRAMSTGGVRLAPANAPADQNLPRAMDGNEGPVRLGGAISIVNGTGSYTADGSAAACQDASPVYASGTNTLCVSCSSSDWLAPSCPSGWNFAAACCETWTRKCKGITPNLGFSAYGPVSAQLE